MSTKCRMIGFLRRARWRRCPRDFRLSPTTTRRSSWRRVRPARRPVWPPPAWRQTGYRGRRTSAPSTSGGRTIRCWPRRRRNVRLTPGALGGVPDDVWYQTALGDVRSTIREQRPDFQLTPDHRTTLTQRFPDDITMSYYEILLEVEEHAGCLTSGYLGL